MRIGTGFHPSVWHKLLRTKLVFIRLCALWFLVAALSACTDRPRSNPFDPRNPEAIVRPTGLRVVSEEHEVRLSWQPVQRSDLIRYTVYRRTPEQTDFQAIAVLPPSVTEFRDRGLTYNREYSYQLSYTTSRGESERSEPVSIIPGPNSKWVLDTAASRLIKLTFDTRHLIFRGPTYFRPLDMDTSRRDRSVWVGEGLADFVDRVNREGTVELRVTGIDEPADLAVNQVTGDCWFYDPRALVLGRIDALGRSIVGFTGTQFSDQMQITVNSLTGEVWLADLRGNTVFRLSPSGVVLGTYTLAGQAGVLEVSLADNALWVNDSINGEIIKISANGELLFRAPGFDDVLDLAANEVTGDCWVAERNPLQQQGRVVRLTATGERILVLDDFTLPTSVAVDLFDNSIVVADMGRRSVRRISEDGIVLGEFTDVASPRIVGID